MCLPIGDFVCFPTPLRMYPGPAPFPTALGTAHFIKLQWSARVILPSIVIVFVIRRPSLQALLSHRLPLHS